MQRCITAVVVLALFALRASAGEFNPIMNIGVAAPSWKELEGVDGKRHSLADLKDATLVLVVFTCNSCDVATSYEDRLVAFAKKHASDVEVVAICVSTKPADALPLLKQRAKAKKFSFSYLVDPSQSIGKAYGANYTPEFFLLDAKRKVAYMGALDDNGDAEKVTRSYVEEAVAALLDGKLPETTETAPRGCRIRYPRSRK
jgi:peroxiredoxin